MQTASPAPLNAVLPDPSRQEDEPVASFARPARWLSSRTGVFVIQCLYLVLLFGFVLLYRMEIIDPRPRFLGPMPFLVPWFGAVGAVLLSLKGIFDHPDTAPPGGNVEDGHGGFARGHEQWDPEYRFWHWSRAVSGAAGAVIGVLIIQAGIAAVTVQSNGSTLSGGAQKNALFYVIAFVIGYNEAYFRRLVETVGSVLFTSDPKSTPK